MDAPAADGGIGAFQVACLVEGVGVDGQLGPRPLSAYLQAGIDDRRGGTPVLVDLKADGTGLQLAPHRVLGHGGALPEQPEVDRGGIQCREHGLQVPGTVGDGGGLAALGRAAPPPMSVVTPEASASSISSGQTKWT